MVLGYIDRKSIELLRNEIHVIGVSKIGREDFNATKLEWYTNLEWFNFDSDCVAFKGFNTVDVGPLRCCRWHILVAESLMLTDYIDEGLTFLLAIFKKLNWFDLLTCLHLGLPPWIIVIIWNRLSSSTFIRFTLIILNGIHINLINQRIWRVIHMVTTIFVGPVLRSVKQFHLNHSCFINLYILKE